MLADGRRQLVEEGVAVRRGLLDERWCARLHAAIERCRRTPGPHYGVLSEPGAPMVDSDLFRWFDDADLAELTHASPLTDWATELIGADQVVLVEDQWFASEPAARTASPWHQDQPYYRIDRPFVTIWITLDDVGPEASLRVVPGSHATGRIYAPVEFSATSAAAGDTLSDLADLPMVPDVDARPDEFPARSWTLRAGDAIALDSRTLHATGRRGSDVAPFRRVSTRWAAPETRYVDAGPAVAAFWDLLPHGLQPGDLLACPTFPLIARSAQSHGAPPPP